ncbi:PLxRFG domain-containing protein [Roseinatronobacter sp. NSM]|uniref:PLxRFG domain-containing protein n=1 Tax=Roseinatronobacter sp. NSM TaxID=3457785 RepID=UPI0040366640
MSVADLGAALNDQARWQKPMKMVEPATKGAQATAKPKSKTPKQKREARKAALADYFTPGNIVKSYGGTDRVLSYLPDDDGGFTVTVESVVESDGNWLKNPNDSRIRTHSTSPSEANLRAGPIKSADPAPRDPASWVIRNKDTGEVVMETTDQKKVDALNTEKYEAVPIREYLASLNNQNASGAQAEATPEAEETDHEPAPVPASKAIKGLSEAENTELAALEAQFVDKFKGQTSSGLDPDMVSIALKIGNLYVRAGRRRFRDLINTMMERMGLSFDQAQPYARNAYNQIRDDMDLAGDDVSDMDSSSDVMAEIRAFRAEESRNAAESATVEEANAEGDADVSDASGNLEPSSGTQPSDGLGAEGVPAAAAPDERGTGSEGAAASGTGRGSVSDQRLSGDDATSVGAGRDSEAGAEAPDSGAGVPERGDAGRSGADSQSGSESDGGRSGSPQSPAGNRADLKARIAAQKAADKARIPVKLADPDNIAETLPLLFESQQQDVLKAETRFQNPDNHGMMFTNGTGTGKTFSGLGVVKRFALQGKNSTLIIAPTQGIISDWIKSAGDIGLDVKALDGIRDAGDGISITTYANLGENVFLATRDFDLVVADEAQTLMQNEGGDSTAALDTFRAITNHPRGYAYRADMLEHELVSEVRALRNEIDAARKSEDQRQLQRVDALVQQQEALHQKLSERRKAHVERFAAQDRSKAVFLSATPFAYDKNVDYAEGYLFDYPAVENKGGYNTAEGRDAFMVQNFGYRMRYNKLTRPEGDVNSAVMERQFHERLKADGALSARVLDVDADYSRAFALIADSNSPGMALGQQIDRAMSVMWDDNDRRFHDLHEFVRKRFDYLTRMRLLEAIKAEAAIDMIKADMALGRKVVAFHDYNSGGGINIFDTSAMPNDAVRDQYQLFRSENPWSDDLNFSGMRSPIETLSDAFPKALIYNGTVSKKAREDAKRLFNEDGSGFDLIVVQSAAGEAGISLHDTTGQHQRVLLNLGMPTRPTTAIQEEGRIYRVGQVTDAIFRYLNTGTDWERHTFAQRIAERASTAENLAMGEQARALKQSFIEAFTESDTVTPGEGEGVGGKDRDRMDNSISPYERAKTYYFSQQKRTGRRDRREGVDYFATPEPVGFKMVEMADLKPGEKALEPSAGHGAIARFFPETVNSTIVEPEFGLLSRAMLAQNEARAEQMRFEDLHIANKYDAIVMNPPFGAGGKTAMEHVAKAMKHLRNGGRIVALIPEGPSANKRYDALMESTEAKDFYEVAEVKLPTATFGRAGTGVKTRVVVIEKHTDAEVAKTLNHQRRDYDSVDNINDLFDRIEDMTINARREPLTKDADIEVYDARGKRTLGGFKVQYTPDTVKITSRIQRPVFAALVKEADTQSGAYDRDAKAFSFPNMEARDNFLEALRKGVEPVRPDESGQSTFTLSETTHAKRGVKLFVASIDARVSPEEFSRLRNLAKVHGGYWSAYTKMGAIPGFQFETVAERGGFLDAAQVEAKESRIAPDQEPVATLRGDELGVAFDGAADMPALRKAAQNWYRDNLSGTTAQMKDGRTVTFGRRGLRKSTTGSKGDVLLRSVPAIKNIIEQGEIVLTEPGNNPAVLERVVIAAPVSIDGETYPLAVSVHKNANGRFHYDLTMDRDGIGRPGVDLPGGITNESRQSALEGTPDDLNLFIADGSVNVAQTDTAPTPDDMRQIASAVKAELSRSIPGGGITANVARGLLNAAGVPIQGRWQGRRAMIEVNPDSADSPVGTLRHEIVHALRDAGLWGKPYGLFTRAEWQGLVAAARRDKALMARIDDLYPDLNQTDRLEEGVAELYRLWARNMDQRSGLDRAFQKIRALFQALANAYRGQGFQSVARTFEGIASGRVGGRGLGGMQTTGAVAAESRFAPARRTDGTFATKAGEYSKALLADGGRVTDAKERGLIGNILTDAMGGKSDRVNLLALVPGEPLIRELAKNIKSAQKYLSMKHDFSAMKNNRQKMAADIAEEWGSWGRKNAKSNEVLMGLMHDVTIAGVSPAEPISFRPKRTDEGKAAYAEYQARHKDIYDTFKTRFDRLPKKAQEMYLKVRDAYAEMSETERQIILENARRAMELNVERAQRRYDARMKEIVEDGLEGDAREAEEAKAKEELAQVKKRDGYGRSARLKSLRLMFESNKVQGDYFPLMRHGNYQVTVKDEAGRIVHFEKFESERAQLQAQAQLKRENPTFDVKGGVMPTGSALKSMLDPTFVADIEAILSASETDPAIMDAIWQKYLETLPELSLRKNKIHRKGTPGFTQDAFRNFSKQMFHGANQLARLKYGQDMRLALDDAHREANEAADPSRAMLVVNEMEKRHDWVMNPQSSAWSTVATTGAFVYYLGATPGAALVNLSQTIVVGIPVLASAFERGTVAGAARHLARGLRQFGQAKGNLLKSKHLTAEEKALLKRAHDEGVVEKTQNHDLTNYAESGIAYNDRVQRVMKVISWMFHNAEVLNREVTFIAAHRMAKENGQHGEQAYQTAKRLNLKTHFDYQSESRPRLQFNDWVRVFTIFRNYQLNMLYRLFRDSHQAFQGATEADRREARGQLIGITGMMMLMAGVSGTWGYALLTTLLGLFSDGGADEVEEEIKAALVNTLGRDMAGLILKGVPGHLTGTDLSNRMGMPELWFRRPDRQQEGQDLYNHWLEQALGPAAGIVGSQFRAFNMAKEGEWQRGFETSMPKALRDASRAIRYASEGVTTFRGDSIIEDISPAEALTQAIGFTPARVSERYQTNRFMKNEEMRVRGRRSRLMADAYQEVKAGGPLSDRTRRAIQEFNAEYPGYPITSQTLRQSFRARVRGEIETVDGVRINRSLDQEIREGRAPTIYN